MMFRNIDLHEAGENGERYDENIFFDYAKGFRNIILWGVGGFGASVGEWLSKNGVEFTFWDVASDELGIINGKRVYKPYATEYDKTKDLLIWNISNQLSKLAFTKEEINNKEIRNNIRGQALYQCFICKNDKQKFNINVCINDKNCLKMYCGRLHTLFAETQKRQDNEFPVVVPSATLIVNQKCNLSCMHCTSYMNQYPKEKRVNFETENILRDMEAFFTNVDAVPTLTIMGGEPFMHNDIGKIVSECLKYDNIGFISMPTNGVFPIKPEQLEGMKNGRFVVAFNNYLPSLSKSHEKIFYENVEKVKEAGVPYSIGRYQNTWYFPHYLYDKSENEEDLVKMYGVCLKNRPAGALPLQIKNGKLFACEMTASVYNLEISNFPSDYVSLADQADLRQRIYNYIHVPYYKACGYCIFEGRNTKVDGSAIQGKMDYFTHGGAK